MNKEKILDNLSNEIQSCEMCDLAKSRHHALPGEGNNDARLMLIAQAPGEVENDQGHMFLGPSGKVLDRLLDQAGILRTQLYMTNLIKCHLPKNRKPKHDEIQACHTYLDQEIYVINPEFLIPLGHYATRYLLQKYHQSIPSKHKFYQLYGSILYIQNQKIYPIQHPAALLHDENIKDALEKNYQKLSVFTHHCKWFSVCPMKYYYNKGVLDRKWIELYCKGDWSSCVRFQKEEQNEFHEDWMLPNGKIDERLREE